MSTPKLEDYALLEKHTLSFLGGVAGSIAEALVESFPAVTPQQRQEALLRIIWELARHLEKHSVGTLEDGRPVLSSLAFVALGSERV